MRPNDELLRQMSRRVNEPRIPLPAGIGKLGFEYQEELAKAVAEYRHRGNRNVGQRSVRDDCGSIRSCCVIFCFSLDLLKTLRLDTCQFCEFYLRRKIETLVQSNSL